MKTLFTILIFFSFAFVSFSQKIDDCYINTKTNDTLLSTLWHNAEYSDDYMLSFRIIRLNSAFILEMKYNFGKAPEFSIAKGDSVWIKFQDGLIISLYSKQAVKSQKGMASYPGTFKGMTTQGVYAKYPLSFIQIMMLQTQPVDKIRIFSSRGFDNIPFSRDDRNTMFTNAKLIAQRVEKYQVISVSPDQDKPMPDKKKKDEW